MKRKGIVSETQDLCAYQMVAILLYFFFNIKHVMLVSAVLLGFFFMFIYFEREKKYERGRSREKERERERERERIPSSLPLSMEPDERLDLTILRS